mmetsp:Transcript_49332/g.122588  ORF Transcript_49332/g.122588 Transcript_49332/m.122588 type:complete len:86 (-) Transcript_49332:240-497(-)
MCWFMAARDFHYLHYTYALHVDNLFASTLLKTANARHVTKASTLPAHMATNMQERRVLLISHHMLRRSLTGVPEVSRLGAAVHLK